MIGALPHFLLKCPFDGFGTTRNYFYRSGQGPRLFEVQPLFQLSSPVKSLNFENVTKKLTVENISVDAFVYGWSNLVRFLHFFVLERLLFH